MKSPAEALAFRHSLLDLLEAGPRREEALLAELERRRDPAQPLYSSLLYLLTHLNFPERTAERHWRRVVGHRERLRGALGRDPGLRVAILDYFANVCGELRNPKVIEIESYERTERSATTDGLTGLFNHAFFLQALRQELLRSRRQGLKAALLLLDLDDFKRVNDLRGHVEGDRALMRATAVLRESVRGIDIAARYGGEEFAVLLPDTSRLGALVVAERIRRRLEERFARSRPQLTVSGGVAVFPEDASTPADLIVRADAALYAAKAAGKNRILFPPAERRRHGRRPDSGRALLSTGGRSRSASVKNVSDGGLLVTLREPVAVGSSVSVWIERPGSSAFDLHGEVVRVDPVGEGGREAVFDVAVRFGRSGPALAVSHP
ncbi:MAG TPA: diguanylate cyclase [Vicinamibacteria bacterium]|nr:diguanylate cyclase [Vicinamibacteria bacterium]